MQPRLPPDQAAKVRVRRRAAAPITPKPATISAQLAGSGTPAIELRLAQAGLITGRGAIPKPKTTEQYPPDATASETSHSLCAKIVGAGVANGSIATS